MDQIVRLYLRNEIILESIERWLRADENGESNGDDDEHNNSITDSSSDTLSRICAPNVFGDQFVENLHFAFEWLIKQTTTVPLARSKNVQNVDENKIFFDINNREAFPSLGEPDISRNQNSNRLLTKRINPTPISPFRTPLHENNTFRHTHGNRDHDNDSKSSDYFKEEREMLRNFKMKFAKNSAPHAANCNDSSTTKLIDVKKYTVIEPKYKSISREDEILKLKALYVKLLLGNHLSSAFFDEIRFTLEVINKRTLIDSAKSENEHATQRTIIEQIFSSYHNCFYFMYLVFEEIFIENQFINFLDYKAVISINSNFYLLDFKKESTNLKETIEQVYLGKSFDITQSPSIRASIDDSFVFFQPETDSKLNFPNDRSFSSFRKQRDEFYRIFNNYNENKWSLTMSADRKIQNMFVSSIRFMLNMSKDVGNFYHLARLFVSQLIKSATDDEDRAKNSLNQNGSGVQIAPTQILRHQHRFQKLQDRFVKKTPAQQAQWTSNLLDESFGRRERFFRDFIYYSDSHSFNEQLKLILKNQIITLTTTDIYGNSPLTDDSIDDESENDLLTHLSRLNLLAKFLGFVCFYPLDTSIHVNENEFVVQQTSLRTTPTPAAAAATVPILDIETYLVNSMANHTLVIAVPWVVEFLIFIDQITLSMIYYENVLSLLCLIYKYYLPHLSVITAQRNAQISCTRFFIQFFLEKLFAVKKFNATVRLQAVVQNMQNSSAVVDQIFHKIHKNVSSTSIDANYLDFHNETFDIGLVSSFFPQYSRTIAELFKQFSNEVRKITPTCVTHDKQVAIRNEKFANLNPNSAAVIRTQAEECFLNIHSSSLKKCVHFLTERVAATCIKGIRCDVYPAAQKRQIEYFLTTNPEFIANDESSSLDSKKKKIDLITKLANDIRSDCKRFVPKYATEKIRLIFPLIIVDDIDESVQNFAIQIALRHIEQRCGNWIDLNITNEAVQHDLAILQRRPAVQGDGDNRESNDQQQAVREGDAKKGDGEQRLAPEKQPQNETAQSVALLHRRHEALICELRETLLDLLNSSRLERIEATPMIELLSRVDEMRTITFLPPSNAKLFDAVVLDIAIAIIANKPSAMNDELLDALVRLWTRHRVTYQRMICAKYLHMISRSQTRISTWLKWEILLTRMLSAAVITFADIETDTFAIVKQDWPKSVLLNFSGLLKSLVDYAKRNRLISNNDDADQGDELNSREIIEWLSWFCAENNLD